MDAIEENVQELQNKQDEIIQDIKQEN